MDLGNARLRLEPTDEYMHAVEAVSNFNESMYFNAFNHSLEMGGWFRIGNRPNEGHAEMSCCVYLPGGGVAFMFQRPEISGNSELRAAGMHFEVVEPFERLRISYAGKVCLLADPQAMDNPKAAFRDNPLVDCRVELDVHGISPMYGGEMVDQEGKPITEAPEEAFARAHYEQHLRSTGHITVAGETFSMDGGLGLRDHSWGPRYWQNLYWYRWLPMVFSEECAVNVSVVTLKSGKQTRWGMLLEKQPDGTKRYQSIVDARVDSEWDEHDQALRQRISFQTADGRSHEISGERLALIPLRNRRKTADGESLQTRITEALTRFRYGDRVGYGMSEYLDQIVDGKPVGNLDSSR